jgi:polysaccharide biosynthesis protein PslH
VSPLRIVLVMPQPPLPFGNAAGGWYSALLRGLVERGHEVTAFAACSGTAEMAEAAALFPAPHFELRCYPHSRATGLRSSWNTARRPRSYLFSEALRHDVHAAVARGMDVLHLEDLWTGWLGLAHTHRSLLSLHYLVDTDFAGTRGGTMREKAIDLLTRRAERRLVRRFPVIRTLSVPLSDSVRRMSVSARVHTIPLAFDVSQFPFEGERRTKANPSVSLIGSFDWLPTRTAASRLLTHLWPEIVRRVPEARLQVVGRAATSVPGTRARADVTVHSDVADIIPYFRSTDVLLYAPERGSGMKVKVLQAFALGTPVVTTRDGIEGIPALDGVHAGVCDDDAGLIERCVTLLGDEVRARRQRIAARELVEATCNPSRALDGIERAYADCMGGVH